MNVSHNIRTINFNSLKIGGETSFPILRPAYVLNIPIYNCNDNFEISKQYFQTVNRVELVKKAQLSDCDILSLQFNIGDIHEIQDAVNILNGIIPYVTKPLMISGTGKDDIDKKLLPELIKNVNCEVILNSINENTYKEIIPFVVSGNHVAVLKTPIDINLAKELNILSADLGLSLDKILIDTDIGGLGYGLEYGYSIMEKIKLEGLKGDEYLNMPIISFACAEALKTKEAKTDIINDSLGTLQERANYFELAAASAVIACGANVIVMNSPSNISVMKGLV